MNKKSIIFLLMVFMGSSFAFGQDYFFYVDDEEYTDLVGSTSLNDGATWDDPEFLFPIGFDWEFFGENADSEWAILDWGYGGWLASDAPAEGIMPMFVPYGADIIDRGYDWDDDYAPSLSNISYLTEGAEGNRIFKLEFNNVGFYNDLSENESSTDYVNFQMWLYEATNDIEIHFGPNSVTMPEISYEEETGTNIELIPSYDFDTGNFIGTGWALSGDPEAPVMEETTDYYQHYINGTIPNGTVYRWSTTAVGVEETEVDLNSFEYSFFPNPTTDIVYLETENLMEIVDLKIYDIDSKLVEVKRVDFNKIDIAHLPAGVYLFQLNTKTESYTTRITKN